MTSGQPAPGRIEVAGDLDVFAVALSRGQHYAIRTHTVEDTVLRVLDGSGAVLAENDDENAAIGRVSSKVSLDAPADGVYFVEVSGKATATPSYVVSVVALSRGMRWVRENRMMVSALTVQMGAPPAASVHEYFDVFGANTVHLWTTGLPGPIAGWRQARPRPDTRWISWVSDDGTSPGTGLVAGGVGANPAGRVGYQIGDEPRTMAALQALEVGVRAVRAADPDGLVILNFTHEALDLDAQLDHYRVAMDGDVVSYDDYSHSSRSYSHLEIFRAAGLASGRPYWRYLNSYDDIPAGRDVPTESDMRWNVFSGLLYGYTGHTWFIYQIAPAHGLQSFFFQRPGDLLAPRRSQFATASTLNREMAVLGDAIGQLTSTAVCYISSLGFLQPPDTNPWRPGAGGDPFVTAITATGSLQDVSVGFFRDDAGERYLMLQNPNHENGSFPIGNANATTITVSFDFSSVTDPTFDQTTLESLDRTSGQVVPLALTSTGAATASLDVRLEAGDPVLFKYKTARPFARR